MVCFMIIQLYRHLSAVDAAILPHSVSVFPSSRLKAPLHLHGC